MRVGLVAVAVAFVLVSGARAGAQSPLADPEFTIRSTLKTSSLFAHAPDAPELFPDETTAAGYARFRVEPILRAGGWTFEGAIEPRARIYTGTNADAGALVTEAPAPWRIVQLEWSAGTADHADWHLEVDRAAAHGRVGAAELTIGRQAVGWGRGVLFAAVDLFSPFSLLEPDREWRRGVDAARADVKLSDRVSVDVVGAFGESVDESIFAARLRGYGGKGDVEVVGGRRARDLFGGVTSSVAIGGTEVHGEAVVFRIPPDSSPLLASTVLKAIGGTSWRVPLGNGLLVFAEYHYSGFGAPSAADEIQYLADPDIRMRYARGDMQLLSRHALALLGTYEQSPSTTWSFQLLQSPVDGSGVVVPTATLTFNDRVSLMLTGYLPYGEPPADATLGSVFGATPLGLFAQLRIYR